MKGIEVRGFPKFVCVPFRFFESTVKVKKATTQKMVTYLCVSSCFRIFISHIKRLLPLVFPWKRRLFDKRKKKQFLECSSKEFTVLFKNVSYHCEAMSRRKRTLWSVDSITGNITTSCRCTVQWLLHTRESF